jgi:hypothetical protein
LAKRQLASGPCWIRDSWFYFEEAITATSGTIAIGSITEVQLMSITSQAL